MRSGLRQIADDPYMGFLDDGDKIGSIVGAAASVGSLVVAVITIRHHTPRHPERYRERPAELPGDRDAQKTRPLAAPVRAIKFRRDRRSDYSAIFLLALCCLIFVLGALFFAILFFNL
jgi:hypothetical protein